jgi:glycosyltransferase involved in cell wall biosynthesis
MDANPRITLFEKTLNSDKLDERYLEKAPSGRQFIYKKLPTNIAQVIEAFVVRGHYDVIISWAENLGIPFAFLLQMLRRRPCHIGIFSWISRLKKALPLKYLHRNFDRIILMSSKQWEYAVHTLGIPKEKVLLLRWPVDQKFWRPISCETNMICAVGREMRDYATLVHAIKDLNIPCHIAAGGLAEKKDAWMKDLKNEGSLPKHITVGKKKYLELRDLYARSRFVVIPLFPTETDNGTTSILEAMAMGKAIICSRVNGQADVIKDGLNGIFVPVGDPKALLEAIEYLWKHPEVAETMGKEGRKHIEKYHTLDEFVSHVKEAVDKVFMERQRK